MKRIIMIEIEGPDKDVLHAVRAIRNVSHMASDREGRFVRDIVLTDDESPRYHSRTAFSSAVTILNAVAQRFKA